MRPPKERLMPSNIGTAFLFRWAALWDVVAILACTVGIARAQPPDPEQLYRATVIVTGTDMRSRPGGFAACLREVLVKVAGEPRLLDDPRLAPAITRPETLVQSFGYVDPLAKQRPHDDQGTYDRSYDLTVRFDPVRVDGLLAELGEHPWRSDRPTLVPALLVRGLGPPYRLTYLLSVEEPAAAVQRASFATSAEKYGMPLRIPTTAEFAAWHLTTDRFLPPALPPGTSEVVVWGTLEFRPEAFGWVGSWQARWNGADYKWGVSGVGYDVAFDSLVRGILRLGSGHSAPE